MGADARIAPIFLVSSVTGESLDLLRMFCNLIPAQKTLGGDLDEPAEMHIDDTFYVAGVGTVVAGTVLKGQITAKSHLMLGPDSRGAFMPIQIKSMMNKTVCVSSCRAGQSVTLAVKKIKRSQIRKGMIVCDEALGAKATWRFTAEVMVLHHPTTIGPNYQPVVHSLTVRQACRVVSLDRECIRTGDRALVTFEFMFRPEYVVLGARLIFREGRTKGGWAGWRVLVLVRVRMDAYACRHVSMRRHRPHNEHSLCRRHHQKRKRQRLGGHVRASEATAGAQDRL